MRWTASGQEAPFPRSARGEDVPSTSAPESKTTISASRVPGGVAFPSSSRRRTKRLGSRTERLIETRSACHTSGPSSDSAAPEAASAFGSLVASGRTRAALLGVGGESCADAAGRGPAAGSSGGGGIERGLADADGGGGRREAVGGGPAELPEADGAGGGRNAGEGDDGAGDVAGADGKGGGCDVAGTDGKGGGCDVAGADGAVAMLEQKVVVAAAVTLAEERARSAQAPPRPASPPPSPRSEARSRGRPPCEPAPPRADRRLPVPQRRQHAEASECPLACHRCPRARWQSPTPSPRRRDRQPGVAGLPRSVQPRLLRFLSISISLGSAHDSPGTSLAGPDLLEQGASVSIAWIFPDRLGGHQPRLRIVAHEVGHASEVVVGNRPGFRGRRAH